jgi:hypothetical protein
MSLTHTCQLAGVNPLGIPDLAVEKCREPAEITRRLPALEIPLILDCVLHNQHVVLPDGLRYVLSLIFGHPQQQYR